jgi:hypothetical protein
MQRVNCEVRLASETQTNNTVLKSGVSPAEIAVLLDLHGEGSVINIKRTHMDKTPHGQERERLAGIYGHHVIDRIFPGQFSRLPVTLEDLNMGPKNDEGDAAHADVVEMENSPVLDGDEGDGDDTNSDLDEDDKLLIASIDAAKSKDELRTIARENEVDLTGIEDKMTSLQAVIKKQLFPAAR